MVKKYLLCIFIIFLSFKGKGQNAVLCPELTEIIGIENLNDVPTVTDNGDDTITLTHSEQYITDIFANHVIYDFFQTFPNTSETLEKYYTILYSEKELIVELSDAVPDDVFLFEHNYQYTPINSEIANFLNEKTFQLTHYCSIADNFGEPCPEQEVPMDVNINVTFNYDELSDVILMESYGLTECGNSFSIALRGGTVPNSLQLWKSIPGTTTETSYTTPCHNIEDHLFSMLDISCNNYNYGDIIPTIDIVNNTLFLYRPNMIFGYHTATFVDINLSVGEQFLAKAFPYQLEGNPFLQFSNAEDGMYIEIYSVAGAKILDKVQFQHNSLLIDHYSNGLYFVKASNSTGQNQIYKFLKR